MSTPRERIWRDVETGRIDEVPQFILEYILEHGCADLDIQDMVDRYFLRLEKGYD